MTHHSLALTTPLQELDALFGQVSCYQDRPEHLPYKRFWVTYSTPVDQLDRILVWAQRWCPANTEP